MYTGLRDGWLNTINYVDRSQHAPPDDHLPLITQAIWTAMTSSPETRLK